MTNQMRKNKFTQLAIFLLFLVLGGAGKVSAQPSDAQIKKDLTGAKTVSVSLGKQGKLEWSGTYKKYVWTRSFTAKVKTDTPDIFVIVKGYAAYDVIGGRYIFWKSFVTSNSYEGITDPTAGEVQALIRKFGPERIMEVYFNRVIGTIESIGLAEDPNFEWHTPNSVSFNIVAVYTERKNDVGGKERLARTFRIRLYRDNVKSEWKNLISVSNKVKKL